MDIFLFSAFKDTRMFLMITLVVVFSICLHEFFHAWTALKFGDTTAADRGHLTLNPLRQMGPMSIIMFLLLGFQTVGITAATAFMFVPGIILSIAWGFAMYLLIDKGVSPLKALTASYDITLGEKWRIFAINLLVGLIIGLVSGLFTLIPKVGFVFTILVVIVGCALAVAVEALMYRHFADKYDAMKEAGEI